MSDSKGDTDGKRDDAGAGSSDAEDADWTLLSKCSAALGDEFDEMFTAFADENAEVFRDAAEGAEEHRLEYDELHKKYLERFEAKLEAFIVKEGASPAEFIADCKSSLEDEFCALFEEDVNKEFVEMILATIEYPSFHKIMVGAARKRLEPKHK